MAFIGILVLLGFTLAGYNMFIRNDHQALLATDDTYVKGKLRGKIVRTSFVVCLGSAFAFHLLMAAFGESPFMWIVITMPMAIFINVLALLVIMEFVNRRKAQ